VNPSDPVHCLFGVHDGTWLHCARTFVKRLIRTADDRSVDNRRALRGDAAAMI
jgi:hypothetical protein